MAKKKKVSALDTSALAFKVEGLLDMYMPIHNVLHDKLSKIANKIDSSKPYTRRSFEEYSIGVRGQLVRSIRTGRITKELKQSIETLEKLTKYKQTWRTVKQENIAFAEEWKRMVFDYLNIKGDKEIKDKLKALGLWNDDKFWNRFLGSKFYRNIYIDYREKMMSAELTKQVSESNKSYWGERLEDFTTSYLRLQGVEYHKIDFKEYKLKSEVREDKKKKKVK